MKSIQDFEAPVKEEIQQYKHFYKNSLKSKNKFLDIISNYVHYRKENKLLSLITVLCAKMSGEVTERTFVAASIIDHLYTATQIHDDVEDEGFSKGFNKISGLWKEKLSVLMGDYFLAKGLLLSVEQKSYDLLEIISKTVKEITEAELHTIYLSRDLSLSTEEYLQIIKKKNASIYATSARIGAISSGAKEDFITAMTLFGENYGIALQIKKELIFENTTTNGKYRITLPLIISLGKATETEKNNILSLLQKPVDKGLTEYFQNFTLSNAGIETAESMREEYKTKALENLTELPYSKNLETTKKLLIKTI
ncbi:MAG TPA: polyprenyl synthetase family protein [Bacteroidales bacterium]|nr:polyprenyl synthetase family protein [Bacteroidales bacterium]